MRRLLTLLFLFITMLGYSQGTATTGSYWRVTKWTTPFRQALPDSTLVLVRDSVRVYMICHVGGVTGTQTMAYADSAGWVCKFPKDLIGYNTTDSIYAKYSVREARISEWVKNDTIVLDTTFPRLYEGSNITIAGSYPNYTISASGVSLVDSTYVKSGMAIRVDSVGKTYIINNISPDSTKVTGLGTNISVLEPTANNWTIRVTESDSSVTNELDSVYVKYADSTRSGWVRNDTIFIDTSGARAMLPQGLNSVMAIDSNTFHQYQGFVWGKRAGIHLQNFSNAPAISLTRASEDATIADSVIAALWGGGSTGYWDGTMLWNKYLKDSAKVVQFNYKKAKLEMRASQTWDQVHNGTYFSFMTTHNDSIIPRDRMKIGHNGNITFLSPGQASSFDSVYVKDVSTGNMKTVYKSSVGAITDSTHIKAGNGIRVDSTGKTFTIVNISRDSTYIKAGTNVTVDSSGNTYTINSSSWPSKDSTYVKSGTGIRVDSVGNAYTVNNITRDSTYLKAGSHVSIDSTGNTYTINSIGWATVDSTYIKSGNGIRVDSTGNTYTVVNIAQDSTTITGLGTNISVLEPSANNYTVRVTEKDSSVTNEYDSTFVDYTGRIIGRSDEWIRNDTIKVDTSCVKLWSGGANVMIEGDCPDWTITVYDDDQSQFNEKDSVFANYTTIVNRSDEWIKNDTILIDTTFTRIYPGNNISISGTYPNYTVSASGVPLIDSTYIKSGNGIRIDSTGSTYTVTNISKDSTYIRSGTNIQVDSSGNTYTINTTRLASIDSLLWQRNASRKAMWTKYPDSVGVGTASPAKLFHVYGNELIKDSLFFSSSNHYITEGPEGLGLKTDELFLARWIQINGNKVEYPLLQGANDNIADEIYDSTFLFTEKANLILGDQTEKNYRLWVNGKIAAPSLTTAATGDSIIAWKASSGEFIVIPSSTSAIYDSLSHIYTEDQINALLALKRNLNNHDSLSTLDEKDYESLTNKPSLTVTSDAPYSAVITLDSSDVILTADSGLSLVLQGDEIKVKNLKRTLASLDEKSYNSLTDKPTDAVTNYEAAADSLTSCNIPILGNPIAGSCQVFLNNYPLTIITQWIYVATNKIKVKLPIYTYDKVQIAYRY